MARFSVGLLIGVCAGSLMAGPWPTGVARAASDGPHITADAAVLVDAGTGRLLWGEHPHQRRAPASTTKILTALLLVESGRINETATVSRGAASTPGSSANLRTGDRYRLGELIKGLLLASGNDAAVAIAEHLAGSVPAFVALMNRRARALGLRDTLFANPHGLTAPAHYSSAYDLALLARAALGLPGFATIVRQPQATMQGIDAQERRVVNNLRNTNRLLWSYAWADGVKTGTTSAAGSCLVASATRDNHRLIAVVLHSDSRWSDALQLLEYGFRHFSFVPVAHAGQLVRTLPVLRGTAAYVGLITPRSLLVAVAVRELPDLRLLPSTAPLVVAPVQRGEVLGSVTAVVGDRVLGRVPLVAGWSVGRSTWWQEFSDWVRGWL